MTMNDWRQRARQLSGKSMLQPTIDKEALAQRAHESEANAAAVQEEQKKTRRRIATAVSFMLTELAVALGSEPPKPAVEEHHKRMLSITAEILDKPVVINILSLTSGETRLTCFVGVDGEVHEQQFEPTAADESVSGWLGDKLVAFFEREAA